MLYLLDKTPDSYRGEGPKRYHQRYGRPSWRPQAEEDFEAWVEDSILASIRRTLPVLHKSVVESSGFGIIRHENEFVLPLTWKFRDGVIAWVMVTRSRAMGYNIHWGEEFNLRMGVSQLDASPLTD